MHPTAQSVEACKLLEHGFQCYCLFHRPDCPAFDHSGHQQPQRLQNNTLMCFLDTLQSWQAGNKELLKTYLIKELGLRFEVCDITFQKVDCLACGLSRAAGTLVSCFCTLYPHLMLCIPL
jgi:hypothetical protein